jgi:hypothetical protein
MEEQSNDQAGEQKQAETTARRAALLAARKGRASGREESVFTSSLTAPLVNPGRTRTVRVPPCLWVLWRQAAIDQGLSLSVWIRENLTGIACRQLGVKRPDYKPYRRRRRCR